MRMRTLLASSLVLFLGIGAPLCLTICQVAASSFESTAGHDMPCHEEVSPEEGPSLASERGGPCQECDPQLAFATVASKTSIAPPAPVAWLQTPPAVEFGSLGSGLALARSRGPQPPPPDILLLKSTLLL